MKNNPYLKTLLIIGTILLLIYLYSLKSQWVEFGIPISLILAFRFFIKVKKIEANPAAVENLQKLAASAIVKNPEIAEHWGNFIPKLEGISKFPVAVQRIETLLIELSSKTDSQQASKFISILKPKEGPPPSVTGSKGTDRALEVILGIPVALGGLVFIGFVINKALNLDPMNLSWIRISLSCILFGIGASFLEIGGRLIFNKRDSHGGILGIYSKFIKRSGTH